MPRSRAFHRWWACTRHGALIFYVAFGSSRHLVVGPIAAHHGAAGGGIGQVAAGKSGAFLALTMTLIELVDHKALAAQ